MDAVAANRIAERVLAELPRGRGATWQEPAAYMTWLVGKAGHGDHLEIGTLHGATAIMAALAKQECGLSGAVVCIDPLAGYYPPGPCRPFGVSTDGGKMISSEIDGPSHTPVTPEVFWENVDHFGVRERIRLVQAFSCPWPAELEDARFVSAYIDGDHYQEGPSIDWANVAPRIQPGGLVWFDDCNRNCPGVLLAAVRAVAKDGWSFAGYFAGQTFVVQRSA